MSSRRKLPGAKVVSKIFYIILNQQVEFSCCSILGATLRVHKQVFVYPEAIAYEIAKDGKNCEVVSGARLILYYKSSFLYKFNYRLLCD